MVSIRLSTADELDVVARMECQPHAIKCINGSELEVHKKDFGNPSLVYLSIVNINRKLSGYPLLALEPDTGSIEFRRIIIDQHQRGIGQLAITAIEVYCSRVLRRKRVWLDVYADNEIATHVYEKLGYTRFKDAVINGWELIYYEKNL